MPASKLSLYVLVVYCSHRVSFHYFRRPRPPPHLRLANASVLTIRDSIAVEPGQLIEYHYCELVDHMR